MGTDTDDGPSNQPSDEKAANKPKQIKPTNICGRRENGPSTYLPKNLFIFQKKKNIRHLPIVEMGATAKILRADRFADVQAARLAAW